MDLQKLSAYELITEKTVPDMNSQGYLLRHVKTGAKVFVLENDDNNKVFYIGFRTPPYDSTGLPHILEHSVLCGSSKYPSKDPFVELAKGSLNTFLNAMTYPDKTVYPVASCNDKDFMNLIDVYMDAVLHTNIYTRPEIFMQEGWHYDLASADDEMTINGVVYNEMKGAFSSPDGILERMILNSLFPDTPYGVESGGDPDDIPSLTYEKFIEFHKKYYHPSNSYIYLYGDGDMAERLAYLDREYLSRYDAIVVDSRIPSQDSFEKVKNISCEYPITEDEPLNDNTYLSYNMCLDTSLNRELYLAFSVLSYALLDTPGAVLKQALLDAGIGKDIQSSYECGIYQPFLSVVAKNANESDKDRFVSIIMDTVKDLVEHGIDKKSLLAALNSLEFSYREADFFTRPKGLVFGLQILDSWLYDDNEPFMHIEENETFAFLRKMIDTDYYEQLLQQYVIDNTHATMIVMAPKQGLSVEKDEALRNKLADYKASLSEEQIADIVAQTAHLKKYQEDPGTKEELEKIPLLSVADMEKKAQPFILEQSTMNDGKTVLLTHDIFTNGIGYVTFDFDLCGVPEELLPYIYILKDVLGAVDTKNYGYAELNNEIDIYTGGIYIGGGSYNKVNDPKKYTNTITFSLKALMDSMPKAFELLEEIAFSSDFSDKKRLYEIVAMLVSQYQESLMSAGHAVAIKQAAAQLSEKSYLTEKTSGLSAYKVLSRLEKNFDEYADDLIAKLHQLMDIIFVRDNVLVDFIGQKDCIEVLKPLAEAFIDKLPKGKIIPATYGFKRTKKNIAYKCAGKVQYVIKAGDFYSEKTPYTGSLLLLTGLMNYDYLWNEVRVRGGAYGCYASFRRTGESYFYSYRDPNLKRTLDVYDSVASFLRDYTTDERGITKLIIGAMSILDTPLTPKMKGDRGKSLYYTGDSYENAQRERDELLGATQDDVRKLAEYIDCIMKDALICVVGGEEAIMEQKDLFDSIQSLMMAQED